MHPARRETAPVALPSILVLTSSLTCGVLAALALQIYLSSVGYNVVTTWETPLSMKALGPWWAVAGAAFVVSGAIAGALRRLPLPWRRFRRLRWILAAALVFGLAQIGRLPEGAEEVAAGPALIGNLLALAVATVMGMVGAYLTLRY